jgi:CBS-domain-containing membrane protein
MMIVSQWMKTNVVAISDRASVGEAAALFVEKHIGTLPVIDEKRRLVGLLHIRDLLQLVMPAFVELVDDFDFVRGDFGAFEELRPSPQMARQSIRKLMEPPTSVRARSGLLRAFAIINKNDLYDLPVVDDDERLVGLVSRVDVGTALLSSWATNPPDPSQTQ